MSNNAPLGAPITIIGLGLIKILESVKQRRYSWAARVMATITITLKVGDDKCQHVHCLGKRLGQGIKWHVYLLLCKM